MVPKSQPIPFPGPPFSILTAVQTPLPSFSYPLTGETRLTCQHVADRAVKDRKPDPDTLYVLFFLLSCLQIPGINS